MGSSSPLSVTEPAADLDILLQVRINLRLDIAVPRHRISVAVANGWVTISGEVAHAFQRSCAEADARSAVGVLGVNNKIAVRP